MREGFGFGVELEPRWQSVKLVEAADRRPEPISSIICILPIFNAVGCPFYGHVNQDREHSSMAGRPPVPLPERRVDAPSIENSVVAMTKEG